MTHPYLDFTFSKVCGQEFLIEVMHRASLDAPREDLTKFLPKGKFMCWTGIVAILSKLLGEDFVDQNGLIKFHSPKRGLNWINSGSLVMSGKSQREDVCKRRFKGITFVQGGRARTEKQTDGSEIKIPPYISYNTCALPLSHLSLSRKAKKSDPPIPIPPEEWPALAMDLEAFHVKEGNGWQPIVSEILQWAKEQCPFKAPALELSDSSGLIMHDGAIQLNVPIAQLLKVSLKANDATLKFAIEVTVRKL